MNRFQDIERIVKSKKYLDLVGNEPAAAIHGESTEGKWVPSVLKLAGDWMEHRYGPSPQEAERCVSADVPYRTEPIYDALLAARFFLEHLFSRENCSGSVS